MTGRKAAGLVAALLLAGVGARAGAVPMAARDLPDPAALDRRFIQYPADLGATDLDVSGYPAEHQRTFHDLVQTKCAICHSPARAISAPYLELPESEAAAFARAHPGAVQDPAILSVGPHVWRAYIKKMWRRPPCCNLCPTFTRDEAEQIWKFLVYDSIQRKTGDRIPAWTALRRDLINRFEHLQKEEGS